MIFGLDYRRRRLLKASSSGPLHDYLVTPFPDRRANHGDVEFLALDLETTGLNPKQDEILSVGMVVLKGGRIRLETAEHLLVAPENDIPERSAVIHQITDDSALEKGQALAVVLPQVLRRLSGRVLLGHHAKVECGFLDSACKNLFGTGFLAPVIDTEALTHHWLDQRQQSIGPGDLRLHALRSRFGLPRYKAHNALMDAIATAELFCAFVANAGLEGKVPLKRFLSRF